MTGLLCRISQQLFRRPLYITGLSVALDVKCQRSIFDGDIECTWCTLNKWHAVVAANGETTADWDFKVVKMGNQHLLHTTKLKIDLPEAYQVSKDAVVKYIGFEDEWNGDHDCNDMVMAIVGDPAVPEEVIITNEEYIVETNNSKRYMVEDLGKTDDFDFNDVVVDMCQTFTEKHKVTLVNGVVQSDVIVEKIVSPQKAVIRALGGTLDFILTIGNTSWTKSGAGFDFKTMYNTGEDGQAIDYQKELASFEVTGWIPEQNNISVKVKEPKKGDIDIAFPRVGSAPMIIATNPDRNWMKERESVPKAWFE